MADMSSSSTASPSTASLSAMKNIVSAVRSGQKDRGSAINELRSILLSQSKERKAEVESEITEITPNVNSEDGTQLTYPDEKEMKDGLEADDFHSDWNSNPESNVKYSMDDSIIDSFKNNRAIQAESHIREEMFKEFTFHPQITELPPSYGPKESGAPFISRVEKWKKEKELDAVKRKEKVYRNSISECTFKPAINPNKPTRSKSLKPDTEGLTPHERLYQVSNTLNAHRAQYIEEELRREQREEDELCTFAPKLHTADSQKFANVKPKYTQPVKSIVEKPGDAELAKCTFSPAIKGVTPKMKAAEHYVNTSVVERLSQTKTPTWSAIKGKDGASSFENSVLEMDDYLKNKGTPLRTPAKSSVSSVNKEVNVNSSSITVEDFNSFISRQQQTTLKKERHIEQITKNCTPDFKPKLCDKSLLMTETNFKGEFMERLEKDGIKRQESDNRLKEVVQSQYSFQPKITPKSEKLRPRSVDELSHGDMLRKENNNCMLKLRIEQEEMAETTFQPEISKKAKKTAKSVLKLHEDPGKVLQMHEEKEKKREQKRLELEKERQDNEIIGCTFHPQTKQCPEFVLRIKKTMDAVKETKKNTTITTPEKPEWR